MADLIDFMIKKSACIVAAAAFYFAVALPLIAEELSSQLALAGQNITIRLEPRDPACQKIQQIKVGKMFCMSIQAKSTNDALLKELTLKSFDAQMPEHRHGMVTRVKIKDSKTGEYLIEGVKLHMPGEWLFDIKFVRGKEAAQVAIPLKL